LELGFVKPSNLIYISSISPVAKLPWIYNAAKN
jgi:hypothetical protein